MKPKILFIALISLKFLFFNDVYSQTRVVQKGDNYYLSNTVVVKFKNNLNTQPNGTVLLSYKTETELKKFGVYSSTKSFPENKNRLLKGNSEIDKIATLKTTSPEDPAIISNKISKMENVEWAEPFFIYKTAYTPNDPNYDSTAQYGLINIKAAEAWDVTKGDTNVVIAIIDTGIDWDHPDLAANIWINNDEIPDNGNDDDQNGFVDDYRGWDFGGVDGTPDNNPTEDSPTHGTHVAGIAGAVTDNNTGVASIGFKSKVMAVKTSQEDVGNNYIVYGYQGIAYAADNGAKVINCSWGGYSYSRLAQEVIDYAVSKGALVVAAAGNDNSSRTFFPAGYNGVLTVGATSGEDNKWYASNYGVKIDVMAPGDQIYSTWQNDTYTYLSGTSMASPLTAGLAALVAAQFPNYTPLQIAEQIRVNTDDIYEVNPDSLNMFLGTGRINAFKAVTSTNSVSVRAVNVKFLNECDRDCALNPGESVKINMNLINYLNSISGTSVHISSDNPYVTITSADYNTGAMGVLESKNNIANPFRFTIHEDVPYNETVTFLLNYSGNYSGFQWIKVRVNPSYENLEGNDISITLTSKGTLGFNDYPNNLEGNGFLYQGVSNLIFEGAFMYGTGPTKLMDAARVNVEQSKDFRTIQPLYIKSPGETADFEGLTKFDDSGAGADSLGIETRLYSYSFAQEPDKGYAILRYALLNKTSDSISNLYAGIFFDWDIDEDDWQDDIVKYDFTNNFGYAYDENGLPVDQYVGAALLSSNDYGFYAIDNNSISSGVNITDNFSDSEKFTTLSGGLTKTEAGPTDISFVISGGPYTIPANDYINVTFVIAAGNTLNELRNSITHSRTRFSELPTDLEDIVEIPAKFDLSQNYPNPFNNTTIIKYSIPESDEYKTVHVKINVYDVLGRKVATLVDATRSPGEYFIPFNGGINSLASGVYIYRIETNKFSSSRKMILLK